MSLAKRGLELKKTDPLRKRIELFLSGDTEEEIYSGQYSYIGKSTKIKGDKVSILKDLGDKCKIFDSEENITTVSKSMLRK
jgi:hypothetical protein